MYGDLWRAAWRMLTEGGVLIPPITTWHRSWDGKSYARENFNPETRPYHELVEMGMAREDPTHYFYLTRGGARFVRELAPDYIREGTAA